jgi:hypothetical protein
MNVSSREKMAVLLGQNIKALMVKQKESPIMLKWEEEQVDLNQVEAKKNIVNEKNSEIINKEVRVSKRQKRNPVNRNKDLFMGDGLMDRVDVIMRRCNMQNKSRETLCNVNYNNCNMRVNVKANRQFILKDC